MCAIKRPASSHHEHGRIVFWVIVLLVLVFLGAVLYFARRPILRALGEGWVVRDELEKAQVIVVLGGDSVAGDRVRRAAWLYREGWAPRVVLIGSAIRFYMSETELMQREAISHGIPADKLLRVAEPVSSTLEEALVLRKVFAEPDIRRVIVVTSNFHARRARRIFRKVFRERGTQIWVDAADDARFEPRRWWEDREQRILFLRELASTVNTWWELRELPPPGGLLLRANVL